MPYAGIPESMTSKMDDCVKEVMGKGHDKDSAIAICHDSLMKGKSLLDAMKDYANTKALDFEQEAYRVRNAFREKFRPPQPEPVTVSEDSGIYIQTVYDDSVIVSQKGKLYRAGYSKDGDKYTFDPRNKWEEVQPGYVPVGKSLESNALKAFSRTDDELRVGNYIVLFGGRDISSLGYVGSKKHHIKNPDGSAGEFFTTKTILDSDYTAIGRFPIDWEHGLMGDKEGAGRDDILGYVDWATKRIDSKGVFVERVLNRRKDYVKWLEELIAEGLIGTSSEAVDTAIERKSTGEITKWPLKRDTLTVSPAEPQNMKENILQAYKSLGIDPKARPEGAEASAGAVVNTNSTTQNTQEDRKMEEKELKALQDAQAAQTKLVEEQAKEIKALKDNLATAQTQLDIVTKTLKEEKPKGSGIRVVDPADTPYKSICPRAPFGKFLQDIRTVYSGGGFSPQLKAILGSNEGIPSEGGFLVPTEQEAGIDKKMFDSSVLASRCDTKQVTVGNSVDFYYREDDSRANGSRYGGITAYRVAEGTEITASGALKFGKYTLKPKEYAAVYYATNDILQDAALLESEVMDAVPAELAFLVDDDIFEGLGVAGCAGILACAAMVSVAKETGQAAATFTYDNVVKMWSRMWARSRGTSVWLINQDVESQLYTMSLPVGTGGSAVFLPPGGASASPYASLFGRPIIPIEYAATLGTTGDVVLADLSQYKLATKGDLQTARSMHVQFLTNQDCFRFIKRVDGQSKWKKALTPFKGTGNTQSAFVKLDTRA